jgi:hypothetical protein
MRQRPGGTKRSRDWVVAVRSRLGWVRRRVRGDPVTEGFELANVVALLAFWVDTGVVVAGAEVVKLDGVVAQYVPDDDQNGTTYRDDGLLLAAAGDAPITLTQERVGPARPDRGLAQDPSQVRYGAWVGNPWDLLPRRLETFRAQTLDAVGELRNLEAQRLDSLQLAMWHRAMDGDVPSAIAVVRCVMSRCRLLVLLSGQGAVIGQGPSEAEAVLIWCNRSRRSRSDITR